MAKKLTLTMEEFCIECGIEGVLENKLCPVCAGRKLLTTFGNTPYNSVHRQCEVNLTPHEVEEYGKQLAAVIMEKGKLEAEKAVLSKRIKPLVERLEEIAPIIDSGKEKREVECLWYYDWDKNERILVRGDNCELLEVDVIPEAERQQHLELAGGSKPKTKKR